MRKRTAAAVLSGALITGAVSYAAVPALASTTTTAVSSRVSAVTDALKGLVSDGTINQSQADAVAKTLDEALPERGGPGGRPGGGGPGGLEHGGLGAAATALGVSTDALRAELRSGKSLAEVAKEKNVSVDAVVKSMVAAAEKDLAAAVTDGRLTQARADEIRGSLTQRITDRVNDVRPPRGRGGPGQGPGDVPGR